LLDTVADVLRARRRKQVSEAERARLSEVGMFGRFGCGVRSDFQVQGAIAGA